MTDIMIDLETWGTRPGCIVRSIGAVAFNASGIVDEFYVNIDEKTSELIGLTATLSTVQWWGEQSKEARDALKVNLVSPHEAIAQLRRFSNKVNCVNVWGHGATFDISILNYLTNAVGQPEIWKFWAHRDTRTLYQLANVNPSREKGVHHNALDDARNQALYAIEAIEKLGVTRRYWE